MIFDIYKLNTGFVVRCAKIQQMFGLFKKDPVKALQQQYQKLMEEAMQLQRNGDLKNYALKIAEAEAIMQKLEALRGNA